MKSCHEEQPVPSATFASNMLPLTFRHRFGESTFMQLFTQPSQQQAKVFRIVRICQAQGCCQSGLCACCIYNPANIVCICNTPSSLKQYCIRCCWLMASVRTTWKLSWRESCLKWTACGLMTRVSIQSLWLPQQMKLHLSGHRLMPKHIRLSSCTPG